MTPSASDGLPQPRRTFAFLAMILAISMAVLDGVAINVALPVIAEDFGIADATSTWVVNVYQLAVVAALLPLAALGEIVGYKRIYIAGLVVFLAMALMSALAPNFGLLVAARGMQGLAAAGIMAINMAMLRTIFPGRRLGRAIGLNAMVVATAATVGPTIAGAVLAVADWRWIFALSVLPGLLAGVIGILALPATERAARTFDFGSAGLSALTFGGILLAVSGVGHRWPPEMVLAQLSVGLVAGWFLVNRQKAVSSPLLPLDLLRIPIFALSVIASICSFTAQMLAFVSLPFYLQRTLGFSAFEAGMLFSAWPLALALMAPVAGMLSDRAPSGILGGVGLSMLVGGLALLATLPPDAAYADIAWRMALCGLGFGLFQTPNNRVLIGSAPRERSAAAGGVLSTARLLGQALGTAIATLALSQTFGDNPAVALYMGIGFALVGIVVSVLRRGTVSLT